MPKTVDFYYDFQSPYTYLCWTQLPSLCERVGAKINYKPMLLGGVFKAHETAAPAGTPAIWEYVKQDITRYAKHYAVPFKVNPHFVFSTVSAMRGAIWALSAGRIEEYNRAMFSAVWAEEKDLSSADVMAEVLNAAGFDAAIVMEAMSQPEIKAGLIQATTEAVESGVFGAPSMMVDDELFFGQDRLEWVERMLS